MQPLATFQQPIHLTGAINRVENVSYILATGFAPTPFPPFYEQAKAKSWKSLTIPSGHDVMLDQPEELAEELLALSS